MQLISVQIEPVITLIIMMYWWLYMHWKQIQTALKAFLNRRITWWIPRATQIEFFEIQHIRCDIDNHLSLSGLSMVSGVYPVDLEIAIKVIQRKWVLTECDVCKKCNQHNVENGMHTHFFGDIHWYEMEQTHFLSGTIMKVILVNTAKYE